MNKQSDPNAKLSIAAFDERSATNVYYSMPFEKDDDAQKTQEDGSDDELSRSDDQLRAAYCAEERSSLAPRIYYGSNRLMNN